MVNNRRQKIKSKGYEQYNLNFQKTKIGTKQITDAVLDIGDFKRHHSMYGDKDMVMSAIAVKDLKAMKEISNFFYRTSGVYSRLCRYMAYLYKYDWYISPSTINMSMSKPEKVTEKFYEVLDYLENFDLKGFFGEVALKVIKNGSYYGYITRLPDKPIIQELDGSYCRTNFKANGDRDLVEFNMKYFDDKFKSPEVREKMLKMFPDEFKKGYRMYKAGKLDTVEPYPESLYGIKNGWYPLEPENTIHFNINGEDYPMLISTIPALIDLDKAQAIDRKKLEQQLLKIIIQTMPIDKNGDLIFDVDEAAQLHNNVVEMLKDAIGVDVLTTFAKVDVADLADSATNNSADDSMARSAQRVYREAGTSEMLFDTNGNIALEKSILNDAAAMDTLLIQFQKFINYLIEPINKKNKKIQFHAQILKTTIYNYQELSKMYKEHVAMGYSKMLPQVALGLTQRSILANAFFENEVLDLNNVFIPPLQSSVMNGDTIETLRLNKGKNNEGAGRPTNESQGKAVSEKTMQNAESQH